MTHIPDPIIFPSLTFSGKGAIQRLATECGRFGSNGILVHGQSLRKSGMLSILLKDSPAGIHPVEHTGGEPTLDQVADLIAAARTHQAKWIAGVGGGSVLDLAKAGAGLYHAPHPIRHYHDGAPLESDALPFAAAPTTAGTGSEASINSVLTNTSTGQKKSIRDPRLSARLVILDPDLLKDCPKPVVAASGMDAFTQTVEAFVSRKATWLTDQFALKGMTLIVSSLKAVYDNTGSEKAGDLLLGSYFSGLALSMARLGVVHGMAHPLGARYHVPHGLVCGICLPHAIELNREAMGDKYAVMSKAVGGDLLSTTCHLLSSMGLRSPFIGRSIPDRDEIIAETLAAGTTAMNPKTVTGADVVFLIDRLIHPPA